MLIWNLSVLFVLTFLSAQIEAGKSGRRSCKDPTPEDRKRLYKEIFREYLTGANTFNIIPHYRNHREGSFGYGGAPQRSSIIRNHRTFKQRLFGEPRCKKTVQFQDETHESSTCPWYVYLHTDPQREPRSIAKAKCSCKGCYSEAGSGRRKQGTCVEVNTYVPVIRWGWDRRSRKCEYYTDLEAVPVGCTCRRVKVSRA